MKKLLIASLLLGPTGAAAQLPDGTLIVTNKAASTVSIIDIASGSTVATHATGFGPHEVAVSPDGRTAITTDYGAQVASNSLTVIDVASASVARRIDLGGFARPHGAAFIDNDVVAITSESRQTVVLVRTSTGEIVGTIPTEQNLSHMITAIAPGGIAYTSNLGSNSVSVLNVGTESFLRSIPVDAQPEAIQVTPDGRHVWVGSNANQTVAVLDPESGTITGRLTGFGWAYRIAFTPDGNTAVLPDTPRGEVRIVDRHTLATLGTVDVAGGGPQGVSITPDGSTAFVSLSNRDRVVAIDLRTRSIVREFATGSRPDGVGFSTMSR